MQYPNHYLSKPFSSNTLSILKHTPSSSLFHLSFLICKKLHMSSTHLTTTITMINGQSQLGITDPWKILHLPVRIISRMFQVSTFNPTTLIHTHTHSYTHTTPTHTHKCIPTILASML